ncbi:hypothetical protein [Escherichia coli]
MKDLDEADNIEGNPGYCWIHPKPLLMEENQMELALRTSEAFITI